MRTVENTERVAESLWNETRAAGLAMPGQVALRIGCVGETGRAARTMTDGPRAFVLAGARHAGETGLAAKARDLLEAADFEVVMGTGIGGEPTVAMADRAAREAEGASVIVALGGGSVMDCAKAAAVVATHGGSALDFLEGVGSGRKVERNPLPLLAVPTTAGTGAEVTQNAVLTVPERGCKRSLRDRRLIPVAALVDPALTYSAPASVTAHGGMDAITQLIEPCISSKRKPEVTRLAHEALRGMHVALPTACREPRNADARAILSLGSTVSGICLTGAGLAMVHGMAGALGALHGLPHGLICGILLPHTLRYNRAACERELAAALAAFLDEPEPRADTTDRGIQAVEALNQSLGIPPDLRFLKLSADQRHAIADLSLGSSMTGNPVPMTPEKTLAFLETLS